MISKIALSASAGVASLLAARAALAQASTPEAAVTAASASVPAASTQPASPPTQGLEEIVVTAQRRSENLQNVPISITALSEATLKNAAINNLGDLRVTAPSLSIDGGVGYVVVHLRGVGSVANGPGFENPIALYIDGVYYANQSVGLLSFNNVSRIEVLKGPQGTLFGRNATGGLIQVLTEDPGQTFKARGDFSYGNYNTVDGGFYVSGPVANDLSADSAIHFSRHDGYGTNINTDRSVYKSNHDFAWRSKVIYAPGDLKFTLIGDYMDRRDSTNALTNVIGSHIFPNSPPVTLPSFWDVNTDTQPLMQVSGGGASIKAEAPLGTVKISNLTAYRKSKFDNVFDYDGSPLPVTRIHVIQQDEQVSDELQLSSQSGSKMTWVAGLFYFHSRGEYSPNSVFFAADPALNPLFPVGQVIINGVEYTDSISGFGQATYAFNDQLSVTGGFRYSYEKRKLGGRQDGVLLVPGSPVVPIVPDLHKEVSFKRPTYRAAVQYKPSGSIMVYASFNTGFKSGGYNVGTPTDPYYKPERLTAYEVGAKSDLMNHRLRINAAAFYYDYKDLQVQVTQATATGFTNGASAHIYGADLDATAVVSSQFQITSGVSLLHAEYRSFTNAPTGRPGGGFPVDTGDATGNRLPYSPKLTFNIAGNYKIPIGANELTLNATWLRSNGYYFEPDNIAHQNSYSQINSTVRYMIDGGRYYVGVYGKNLTNAKVKGAVVTNPAGFQDQTVQPPRTYGVTLGVRL